MRTHSLTDVIACAHCQSGEDGNLLIGAPARVSDVRGLLKQCPSCQSLLRPDDTVAVGIETRRTETAEVSDAA